MRRERMSRPTSSVPHQCAAEGDERRVGRSIRAGSCGATHGANRARITKNSTRTTPMAASGLCRARRGSEMAVADIAAILAGGPEFKWLKLLSSGYLTSKEKRFGVSALSAEFE